MSTATFAEPATIRLDADGVLRVGPSRLSVDAVVHAYNEGASPEEIHMRFDSVPLADIHSVIAYYLRDTGEIDAYLARREEDAKEIRKRIEERQGVQNIRERLEKRIASCKQD
jgi:uncharacterized protein (DUF433 family)